MQEPGELCLKQKAYAKNMDVNMLGANLRILAENLGENLVQGENPVQGENHVRRVKFVIGPQNVVENLVENHVDVGHVDNYF